MELTDWRDVPIQVGDHIVYPQRQGASMWMTEGKVVAVSDEGRDQWGRKMPVLTVERLHGSGWRSMVSLDRKRVKVTATGNVTVVSPRP
jgi:expansin (peptidoglycan-binding protein)